MSGNATRLRWRGDIATGDLAPGEAAAMLGVSTAALERWSAQLSFPHDVGSATDGPRFRRTEIEALRDALDGAHSVEGAVRAAQRDT